MTDDPNINTPGTGGPDGPAEDVTVSGEYVLGLLGDTERAAFETRLRDEPELRRLVFAWEEHFAPLAHDIPDVAPPKAVWDGIENALFDAPAKVPWWRQLGLGQAIVGAVAAAAFAFFALSNGWLLPDPGETRIVAELQGEQALYAALVQVDAETSTLIIDRSTAAPAEGRDHELWVIVGQAAPVSLGVLPRSGVARVALDATIAAALNGAVLAVSDEPLGGSPTGSPTGDVLAVGAVSLG